MLYLGNSCGDFVWSWALFDIRLSKENMVLDEMCFLVHLLALANSVPSKILPCISLKSREEVRFWEDTWEAHKPLRFLYSSIIYQLDILMLPSFYNSNDREKPNSHF